MSYDVAVTVCSGYSPDECARALGEVLAPLGGLDWVTPGMKIAVKVNLVMAKSPEHGATTHPGLVCALCDMLVKLGAEVVVGDSPGGPFNLPFMSVSYGATGMTEVERHGARLNRSFGIKTVTAPESLVAKQLQLCSYLLEADAIIDFGKLKTHGLMAYTGACKNMFGAIPGFAKLEYHHMYPNHADFAGMLVDINQYLKPRLCIVDGVLGMEGNGPTAGKPRFIGALLAGWDPHKVDLAGAHIIGLSPAQIPTLITAQDRGLIPKSYLDISIHGDIERLVVPDFDLIEPHGMTDITDGKTVNEFIKLVFNHRPKVSKKECVGCGECSRICPAKAISMKHGLPDIDRKKCIRCFCCQEFCPKGAMKVHRPVTARLLSGQK